MNLGYVASLLPQLPTQLVGYMTQSQWEQITSKFRRYDTDATFISCAGEWVCCLCTGFFCIFCCHPFFHNLLVTDNLEKYVYKSESIVFLYLLIIHFTLENVAELMPTFSTAMQSFVSAIIWT